MTPERWQRQKAVFSQVQSASPEDRIHLLDLLCGGDPVFRKEMEELLAGVSAADPFLDNGVAPPPWKPGDTLASRFELTGLAGEGGMGQVWAARDRKLENETVAIKTIHARTCADPAAIERFKRELQLARRVAHPNVCKLYDLYEDDSGGERRIFLSMELLEGETLAARLKREGRIQPAEAMDWMRQLCAGAEAAHAAGVIHRDLKPGNIMLAASHGGKERAVITDFGLARASEAAAGGAAESALGLLIGTPEYMAPEQIRGEAASPATDVYALGLIFYEMLRGQQPFAGKNTMETWMRRIREGPPKLSGVVEDIPARLDGVIARCLEYEPAARYGSAGELWEAIEGRRGRSWKWPPGRRWTAGAAACLLAGAGAWLTWGTAGGPDAEAMLWYRDARRDLAEGAALRASNQLRRAIATAPRFPAAYAALAEAQLELDQNAQARESVLRASALVSGGARVSASERAHIDGAGALLLRDCPAAIEAYRAHVASTGAEARPYAMTSLARAMERCDQLDDARKTLAEAAKLDGRNAAVLVRLALLAHRVRDRADAESLLDKAEALYRERANFEGVAETMLARGGFRMERDELDSAGESLDAAMKLAKTTGNVHQEIRILFQQSNVARRRGKLGEAREVADAAIGLARRNGLETLALQGIFAGANVHAIKNENGEAVTELERALEIAARYRDEENQARANLSLAVAYQRLLRPEQAEQAVGAALPYYERIGHGRNLASANYLLGNMQFAAAKNAAAAARFRRVREEAKRIGDTSLELLATQNLARTLLETGDFLEAESLSAQAVADARKTGRKRSEAYAAMAHAEALSVMGRGRDASRELAEAKRLIAALEPEAATAPRRHLRIAEAAGAVRQGHYAAALGAIRGVVPPADSPGSHLEILAIQCEANEGAGRHAEALAACVALRNAAERGGSKRHLLKGRLLEAEIRAVAGDRQASRQLAADILAESQFDDAPFTVLLAQLLQARMALQPGSRPDVSRTLAALRLKLGEQQFLDWSRRADIAVRIRAEQRK